MVIGPTTDEIVSNHFIDDENSKSNLLSKIRKARSSGFMVGNQELFTFRESSSDPQDGTLLIDTSEDLNTRKKLLRKKETALLKRFQTAPKAKSKPSYNSFPMQTHIVLDNADCNSSDGFIPEEKHENFEEFDPFPDQPFPDAPAESFPEFAQDSPSVIPFNDDLEPLYRIKEKLEVNIGKQNERLEKLRFLKRKLETNFNFRRISKRDLEAAGFLQSSKLEMRGETNSKVRGLLSPGERTEFDSISEFQVHSSNKRDLSKSEREKVANYFKSNLSKSEKDDFKDFFNNNLSKSEKNLLKDFFDDKVKSRNNLSKAEKCVFEDFSDERRAESTHFMDNKSAAKDYHGKSAIQDAQALLSVCDIEIRSCESAMRTTFRKQAQCKCKLAELERDTLSEFCDEETAETKASTFADSITEVDKDVCMAPTFDCKCYSALDNFCQKSLAFDNVLCVCSKFPFQDDTHDCYMQLGGDFTRGLEISEDETTYKKIEMAVPLSVYGCTNCTCDSACEDFCRESTEFDNVVRVCQQNLDDGKNSDCYLQLGGDFSPTAQQSQVNRSERVCRNKTETSISLSDYIGKDNNSELLRYESRKSKRKRGFLRKIIR